MALDSMKEIFDQMERENIPFWEVCCFYPTISHVIL